MDDLQRIRDTFCPCDENYCLTPDDIEWLIKQSEKVGKLQKQLDAKIMFVNNGMDEDMYVLQEKVIALQNENEQLGELLDKVTGHREQVLEKVERYEIALIKIQNKHYNDKTGKIAKEALKECGIG